MNVLLVDDEADFRAVLGGTLRREGWNVLCAADAEEAWAVHGRAKTNLVICDWNMPGGDGLELCRRFRAIPRADYVYFILMTGLNVTREDVHACMRAGVDDVLVKPLDIVLLSLRLRAAQRVLGYANRLHELESVIPICTYCRRLRDQKDSYQKMEAYFLKHAGVLFSHGACPECLAARLAEIGEQP